MLKQLLQYNTENTCIWMIKPQLTYEDFMVNPNKKTESRHY
jgi:hypothetical protein